MSPTPSSLWSRVLSTVDDLSHSVRSGRFEETLDQEIRQLDIALKEAQENHDCAKATRIHALQQAVPLNTQKKELEEQLVRLLRGNRKTKAKAVADQVAAVAQEALDWELKAQQARVQEQEFGVTIHELEGRLQRRRYQVGTFRASANLQRTQDALAKGQNLERPATALDALNRLRQAISDPLPSPEEVVGEPPEPTAETAEEILSRLAKTSKPNKSPSVRAPRLPLACWPGWD